VTAARRQHDRTLLSTLPQKGEENKGGGNPSMGERNPTASACHEAGKSRRDGCSSTTFAEIARLGRAERKKDPPEDREKRKRPLNSCAEMMRLGPT